VLDREERRRQEYDGRSIQEHTKKGVQESVHDTNKYFKIRKENRGKR